MNKFIVPSLYFFGALFLWLATAIVLIQTMRGK